MQITLSFHYNPNIIGLYSDNRNLLDKTYGARILWQSKLSESLAPTLSKH